MTCELTFSINSYNDGDQLPRTYGNEDGESVFDHLLTAMNTARVLQSFINAINKVRLHRWCYAYCMATTTMRDAEASIRLEKWSIMGDGYRMQTTQLTVCPAEHIVYSLERVCVCSALHPRKDNSKIIEFVAEQVVHTELTPFISRYRKSGPITRSGLDSQKSDVAKMNRILQDNTQLFCYMFHCPVDLAIT